MVRIIQRFLFLVLLLSSSPLSGEVGVSTNDRRWLEDFFTQYLLNQPSLYTVFGSKPMSSVGISIYPSLEARKKASSQFWELIHQAEPNLTMEQEQKLRRHWKQYSETYNLDKLWEKWLTWKENKFPNSPFLFSLRPSLHEEIYFGYIINIREVVWTLVNHYDVFSRELGMDFDPIQVTLEFENPDSAFWSKIFENHYLMGILYGFGQRNAYLFSKSMELKSEAMDWANHPLFASDGVAEIYQEDHEAPYHLPRFRSFFVAEGEDPIVTTYKREQERIQTVLEKRGLVDEVLNYLNGEGK